MFSCNNCRVSVVVGAFCSFFFPKRDFVEGEGWLEEKKQKERKKKREKQKRAAEPASKLTIILIRPRSINGSLLTAGNGFLTFEFFFQLFRLQVARVDLFFLISRLGSNP
jgi:hypothetical protein